MGGRVYDGVTILYGEYFYFLNAVIGHHFHKSIYGLQTLVAPVNMGAGGLWAPGTVRGQDRLPPHQPQEEGGSPSPTHPFEGSSAPLPWGLRSLCPLQGWPPRGRARPWGCRGVSLRQSPRPGRIYEASCHPPRGQPRKPAWHPGQVSLPEPRFPIVTIITLPVPSAPHDSASGSTTPTLLVGSEAQGSGWAARPGPGLGRPPGRQPAPRAEEVAALPGSQLRR